MTFWESLIKALRLHCSGHTKTVFKSHLYWHSSAFKYTNFKYESSSSSQSDFSVDSPEQYCPPFRGAGLEQERLLDLWAPLQDDQVDQQAQLPWITPFWRWATKTASISKTLQTLVWRDEKWGGKEIKLWSLALTLLTLYFSSVLTGQAWCTRLTHTFAVVSVGENNAVVSAGLAVAGVALRQVLLNGPAEVQLLHAGTLDLLYQLW